MGERDFILYLAAFFDGGRAGNLWEIVLYCAGNFARGVSRDEIGAQSDGAA